MIFSVDVKAFLFDLFLMLFWMFLLMFALFKFYPILFGSGIVAITGVDMLVWGVI